jgi:predicted TIM-barrel fold metal-dependent hydrolase
MKFFDACLGVGRTSGATDKTPKDEKESLELMDDYDVAESLVYHYVSRDSDPDMGNQAINKISSQRLHKIWAIDPAYVIKEKHEDFVKRGLQSGAKAFLINPLMRNIKLTRSHRLLGIAEILAERKIPLFAVYHAVDMSGNDVIDWYELADFCNKFDELPVIAKEWRTRSNRPLFDALADAGNLKIVVSNIWQNQMIAQIAESFGDDRLLFSMGIPSIDPGSFQMPVIYAELSEQQKNNIAYNNMKNLINEADYECR